MIYENDYIYEYCNKNKLILAERGKTLYEFLFNYHLEMMNWYKDNESNNQMYINDNEFDKLLKIIKSLNKKSGNIFTKTNLNIIKKSLKF